MSEQSKNKELKVAKAAAMEWAVRRKDRVDWDEADSVAFETWINASELHRIEYDKAAYALSQMNNQEAFDASEVQEVLQKSSRKRRGLAPIFGYSLAAAASIALVIFGMSFLRTGEVYRTEIAQIESRILEDGTRVTMDAGTRIRLLLDDVERKVVLLSGSIVFDVDNEDPRPFSVEAGESLIRDIGTVFSVSLREDLSDDNGLERVAVAVEEGVVDIYHKEEPNKALVRLKAGDQALYQPMFEEEPIAANSPTEAPFASWRERQFHYRNQPLGEVLADLQRHYAGEIVFVGEGLGEMTVSGTISVERLEKSIYALEQVLPLKVTEFSE
ncbi:MAG: FecR domain-containing protein, partial [Verrucomicrobiota bacterium]